MIFIDKFKKIKLRKLSIIHKRSATKVVSEKPCKKRNGSIKYTLVFVLSALLLVMATRGDISGDRVRFQNDRKPELLGPFELSNSTSRFALTEAIVKNGTFFLTEELAKFSAPDLVDYNGKFISIFTPGVSFIGIPFYVAGLYFGIPQISTFSVNTIFALLNIYLVSRLAQKLGAGKSAGLISGLIFLFGTNALAYSQTFTQHHISTSLILLSLINSFSPRNAKNNLLLGLFYGLSVLVDIPNAIMLMPVIVYTFLKSLSLAQSEEKYTVRINFSLSMLVLGIIPAVVIFGFYNYSTTGSYTKLAQNIGRSKVFRDITGIQNPVHITEYQPYPGFFKEIELMDTPFKPRHMLRGFYTLLISNERAWVYYSPVVLIGILGLYIAYKNSKYPEQAVLLVSVVTANILLYSMFGDPWGGWAFGPRYLIPSSAIICTGLGLVTDKLSRKYLLKILFSGVIIYSVYVSTLGVMTSQAIPPKQEAKSFPFLLHYTYRLNEERINNDQSSNFIYNYFLKDKIPFRHFVWGYAGTTSAVIVLSVFLSNRTPGRTDGSDKRNDKGKEEKA